MPERQGIVMNPKKLRRLFREEWLQVRRRFGHKEVAREIWTGAMSG
jgi:putative transposase